jgi:phospholipid/cholesterol/gamma-HCH transport system permease protein
VAEAFAEAGAMAHVAGLAVARTFKQPRNYGPEFVTELRFAVRVAFLPLVLTSFALAFGPAGIQASNFFVLFGALDRLGGAYELIVVREFAPLVSAIVVAGAVGTGMCADLGAREIREETAALKVLGVDPIKSLVVPRLLAVVAVTVLFNVFALFAGMAGALLVVIQHDSAIGPFFATFFAAATPLEFGAALVKCVICGTAIGVICCYKGLNASGGSEGVGRAVNQAVVLSFIAIGAIGYVFTQFLLATNPILSETR